MKFGPRHVLAACLITVWPLVAVAQAYPAKPVRVIVPWPASGGSDFFARLVTDRLAQNLGQRFIVDNRPGAGGTIGSEAGARASPDGYTLLFTTPDSLTISPRLGARPPYDALKDFAPVVMVALTPNILVAHPSLPVRTVKDLVALAKAHPGAINYASNGVGTLSHLTGELFRLQAGINWVHVPYNGGPPAVLGVVMGEASVLFTAFPTAIGQVRAGKLRALGVCSARRVSIAPDLPAVAETLHGFESSQWYGLFAPAATPADVMDRLNNEIRKILSDSAMQKQFLNNSAEPVGGSAADLAAALKADYEKWGSVLTQAAIRAD